MTIPNKIFDPLAELYHSESQKTLNDNFKKICENYFIETFALAMISKREAMGVHSMTESSCFENYPEEWMSRYINNKYYLEDPVYSFAQNITKAHYWHIDHFKLTTNSQKKILAEACDFGIKRGTTIPLLPNGKFNSFLTLIDTNIHHPEVLYVLANASNIYINKKEYFSIRDKFDLLTSKEMEVLSLKAEGYPTKLIAKELLISEATVTFHLGNIKRKLGFVTIDQAVYKYIITTNK